MMARIGDQVVLFQLSFIIEFIQCLWGKTIERPIRALKNSRGFPIHRYRDLSINEA
jgi:hypothetical protein